MMKRWQVGLMILLLVAFGHYLYVSGYPNMYSGQVTSYEYCPNYPKYCHVMKAVSDRDTHKAHSVSEGYVTAEQPFDSAFVKIYYESETEENRGNGYLKVYIYNYDTHTWTPIVSKSFSNEKCFALHDIGDRIRAGDCDEIVTHYGQCCSYYRDTKRTYCAVSAFNATDAYIDETGTRMKFKLDMYVQGREDNSVNVVEVRSIWADFNYIEEPPPSPPAVNLLAILNALWDYIKSFIMVLFE